jgi:UDP-N-acetylglucosamine 4,6-dehydratase
MDALRETLSLTKPDIIIHAAATKYVHLAEQFPNECLDINIKGSQNIVRAAIEHNVETVIGISNRMDVMPSGNVVSCKKFTEFKMGNLHENEMKDV